LTNQRRYQFHVRVSFFFTRLRCCGLAKKTLRLLFHERLAALPEMYLFKWTYFHERALPFPQRCCQGHGAANVAGRLDGVQRIPAAGSGGIVPRCWVETDGGGTAAAKGRAARGNNCSDF